MMEDKNTRQALIEKYLDAETTPEEERKLREWFASHEADEDEQDFALLVGLEAPCASCLPEVDGGWGRSFPGVGGSWERSFPELDTSEAEFDRILAGGGRGFRSDGQGMDDSGAQDSRGRAPLRGRRRRWLVSLAAAAAVVAIVCLALPSRKTEPSLPPVVIAESIRQILLLSPDDIESVEARPDGSRAILTAHLKDGSSCSYILTYDENEDTTTLLACQNPSK